MKDQLDVRACTARDLDALYEICLRTADNGGDGAQLYDDPQLPGQLYAAPYAHLEPGFASVAEDRLGVCGYVVAALDTTRYLERLATSWLPALREAHPAPFGPAATWSESDRLRKRFHEPEQPLDGIVERYPSHLHINLLPRAQGRGVGRRLLQRLFEQLRAAGSTGVHLGVMERNTGAVGFYHRLGFVELGRRGPADGRVIDMGLAFD